jgi:hypothetical protein
MRILMMTLVVLVAGACSGNTPASIDSGRVCNGQLYDSCLQEHDCTSQNCRNFLNDGFTVCTMTCTVGDDTSCGKTLDGRQAICDQGICKPPGPNDCVLMF